ncbi:hypothetical protein AALB64_06560 [Lachnospiraceae bacterium 45-P1]
MNTESSSLSKIERRKNFIIDFLYWAIIVACIFAFLDILPIPLSFPKRLYDNKIIYINEKWGG